MRASRVETSQMKLYRATGKSPISKALYLTHTSTKATSTQALRMSWRNFTKPCGLSIQKINLKVLLQTTTISAKKFFPRSHLRRHLRLLLLQKEFRYIILLVLAIMMNFHLSEGISTSLKFSRSTIKKILLSFMVQSGYLSLYL